MWNDDLIVYKNDDYHFYKLSYSKADAERALARHPVSPKNSYNKSYFEAARRWENRSILKRM